MDFNFSSPIRGSSDIAGLDSSQPIMPFIYKERFPKSKAQMEMKLQQFLLSNASLSGFTTSMALNVSANASPANAVVVSATSSPLLPQSSSACFQRPVSPQPQRQCTPRPSSPLPPRPISPLATMEFSSGSGAAAAVEAGAMFRRCGSSNNNLSTAISPGSSFVYSAGTPLPPTLASVSSAASSARNSVGSGSGSLAGPMPRSERCSFLIGAGAGGELSGIGNVSPNFDPNLLRLISEGATRFLHHQICEIVADCLQKSREDLLTCVYFCNMSVRLDETLAEVFI